MEWWDDLWLNESFATFMASKALDEVFPEWKMDDQYLIDAVSAALNADQLVSTHPISVNVKNPAEVEQIFDTISYEKGGSVLYMLESYVGHEVFRKGLHNFLRKHAYSNATKSKLWDEIGAEARKQGIRDVETIARTWIDIPGYPVIGVSRSHDVLRLVQNRLTLSKSVKSGAWPIPLNYGLQNGSKGIKLMLKKKLNMKLDGNAWIKLNYAQSGFYRASYPEDILEELGKAISEGTLHDRDAWGVVNDLFFLARSARVHLNEYLDFVTKYCMVDAQLLNLGVLSNLGWLCTILRGTDMQEKANDAAELYGNFVLGMLTWNSKKSDNNLTAMLRASSISLLGFVGDRIVAERSRSAFESFVKKGKRIAPDLHMPVYINVVRSDPGKMYGIVKRLYIEEDEPEEKRRFLVAMGAASDKAHVLDVLSFSASKHVKLQDSLFALSSEAGSPESHEILWKWFKLNWKPIRKKYPVGMHRRFVELFGTVKDERIYEDMKRFFGTKGNAPEEARRALAQTLERIAANIAFIKRNTD
jgi:tricorn protease interacting factor F2/3